jgi:hypothetical protein
LPFSSRRAITSLRESLSPRSSSSRATCAGESRTVTTLAAPDGCFGSLGIPYTLSGPYRVTQGVPRALIASPGGSILRLVRRSESAPSLIRCAPFGHTLRFGAGDPGGKNFGFLSRRVVVRPIGRYACLRSS